MKQYNYTQNISKKDHVLKAFKSILLFCCIFSFVTLKAQSPYPNTGDHQVCINSTEPYGVVLNAGSTYLWTITPIAGGNGTITAGATPNLITVNWTNAGTAKLQVTETNASGCTGDPVSIIVTILPKPTVSVNSSAICAGTSATIIATPGTAGTYNYAWTVPAGVTNPGNVASFTASVAGTYSVIITTAGTGCSSASASGTVTINAAPNLVINDPAICGTGTADLTAASVTAGSTAGLTFTYWTDAAATIPYNTPTAATAGTYFIKGTLGAGCFDIKPVTVTVTAAPNLVITNPAAVCGNGTADLMAPAITAGSTTGLTFTYWTDAAATIPYNTPATATAGTYYIKGSSGNSCFVIKPVVVTVNPAPTPAISGPSPVCQSSVGGTVVYSTPNLAGHTYNWTITGGTIVSGQNTSQITVSWTAPGAATVSVTETITAGGCNASITKNITVTPKPVTSAISHN